MQDVARLDRLDRERAETARRQATRYSLEQRRQAAEIDQKVRADDEIVDIRVPRQESHDLVLDQGRIAAEPPRHVEHAG